MRSFYILVSAALMCFFTGCGGESGGQPDPNVRTQLGDFEIHSRIRAEVQVKFGDESVSLGVHECIKVEGSKFSELEIIVPSWFAENKVLCSSKAEGAVPCIPQHNVVIAGVDGGDDDAQPDKPVLTQTTELGCTKKMGEEEAADVAEGAPVPEAPEAEANPPAGDGGAA